MVFISPDHKINEALFPGGGGIGGLPLDWEIPMSPAIEPLDDLDWGG